MRLRVLACLAALLSLPACGGGGGVAGQGSHDSPDGAVRGLVDALAAGDDKGAVDWVAPGERSDFSGALDQAKQLGLAVSFQVRDFQVVSVATDKSDPDKAFVKYRGQAKACFSGGGDRAQSNCTPIQSQTGQSSVDTFVAERQDGKWYVSISTTTQGTPGQ